MTRNGIELPTTLLREDNKYLYFTAETPGFSPFAITGKIAEKQTDVKVQPESEDKEENTGSTAGNIELQSENKDNISTPGFEVIYGIACLFGMFLYRRQKV